MRILFLTQYFPPEIGAPQVRILHLAKKLKKTGHDVNVLTAMPNYPKGRIFENYQGKLFYEEIHDKIPILRCWVYTSKSKSFIIRLMNYFSFCITSLIAGIFISNKIDLIIVESPPLFLGITGYALSKINKANLVGFACIIDRSDNKVLIKENIVSQVKIKIDIFKENEIPDKLKKIPTTKPGSKNLSNDQN